MLSFPKDAKASDRSNTHPLRILYVACTSRRLQCELPTSSFPCVFFSFRLLIGKPRNAIASSECQRKPTRTGKDSFQYERVAFYSGIKEKAGLIFAKAAALRININTDGSPVAMGRTHITHGSHAPRFLPSSLSQHLILASLPYSSK